MVGFDLQIGTADDAAERIARKREQIAVERRTAEEEQRTQDARQEEARQSIARIEADQREADDQLNRAQRRLFDAREAMQAQSNRTAEAKATHAALVERTSALAVEVRRLEDASAELETRLATTARGPPPRRRAPHRAAGRRSSASEARLDAGVRTFDEQRERVREAEERSQTLRSGFDEQDGTHPRGPQGRSKAFAPRRSRSKSRARPPRPTCRTWRHRASSPCRPRSTRSRPKSRRSSATACWPARRPIDDRPDAAETDADGDDAPASRPVTSTRQPNPSPRPPDGT